MCICRKCEGGDVKGGGAGMCEKREAGGRGWDVYDAADLE